MGFQPINKAKDASRIYEMMTGVSSESFTRKFLIASMKRWGYVWGGQILGWSKTWEGQDAQDARLVPIEIKITITLNTKAQKRAWENMQKHIVSEHNDKVKSVEVYTLQYVGGKKMALGWRV